MTMDIEKFAEKAIDVPFEEFGRSWAGWDCWGIPFLGYQEILNIQLPNYLGEYGSTRRRQELRDLIDRRKTKWAKVDTIEPMDCVLLNMMGRACHIGLMLDKDHMLHVEENCMTMIEEINRAPWRSSDYNKVEGIYRYVG